MRKIDPATTTEQIDALFKKADADGGGFIDFEEFHAAVIGSSSSGDDDGASLDLGVLVMKKARANIRDEAAGRVFLVVFLLYPGNRFGIPDLLSCLGRDLTCLVANRGVH